MAATTSSTILPLKHKLQYSLGNYGKSLLWNSLELFLLFYLTDVLEIPPTIAGVVVFVSLVWGGILDPVIGYLIDSRVARGGSYKAFLIWGAVFSSISFTAIFYAPQTSMAVKILYVFLANLTFRTFYAVFDVPHNALLARLVMHSHERTTLSGQRLFFSTLGALTIATGISPALIEEKNMAQPEAFFLFAVITALVSLFLSRFTIKVHDSSKLSRFSDGSQQKLSPSIFLHNIWSNREIRLIFIIAATTSFSIPIFSKLLIYFAKYSLLNEKLAGPLLSAMIIGQLTGLPVWVFISKHLSKAVSAQLAHCMLIVILFGLLLISIAPAFVTALIFCAGFSIGGIYMLVWAMAPDGIASIEAKHGTRPDAACMAFLTFSQKLSIGLGAVVAGVLLDLSGFKSPTNQASDAGDNIRYIMCLIPICGAMTCTILLRVYRRANFTHTV